MRIWSLHPSLLDRAGLLAVWREGLLAQKVLAGNTRGYKNHPQLIRFKKCPVPLEAIGAYLLEVYNEACNRNYTFNSNKILFPVSKYTIPVTNGQVVYERQHLNQKLLHRDPARVSDSLLLNPVFVVTPGDVEEWEKQ